MDLLEYQAKELFRQAGIPVLPSQRIDRPGDIKGLRIPYPVVLKSQVYTGERGKAGGIRFVRNTIDAIAAAQTIFHLPIMGRYPKVLLAEAKYDAEREFYLAVVLDSSTRRPLLLGSQQGGMEVESNLESIQRVLVDQEFSPFYARRLALKMGLEGDLIQAVSSIVENMYRLFIQHDLDLVEINPLAISATGELMALDGRVTVNDAALGRQLILAESIADIPNQVEKQRVKAPLSGELDWVEREGNIGVLCNGVGLTLTTVDQIHKAQGKLAHCLDLGGEYRSGCSCSGLQKQIEQGLDLLMQEKGVKVVLVNMLSSSLSCVQVADAIASYLNWQPRQENLPPLIVRLVGTQFHTARGVLAALEVPVFEQMEEAVALAVAIAENKQIPKTQSSSPLRLISA
jgi:succinyl-CoA synthetase beta subunit